VKKPSLFAVVRMAPFPSCSLHSYNDHLPPFPLSVPSMPIHGTNIYNRFLCVAGRGFVYISWKNRGSWSQNSSVFVTFCRYCSSKPCSHDGFLLYVLLEITVQSSKLAPPTPSLSNECSSPPVPRDPSGGEPHSFIKTHVTIMIKKNVI
jgi:hypothetical protein